MEADLAIPMAASDKDVALPLVQNFVEPVVANFAKPTVSEDFLAVEIQPEKDYEAVGFQQTQEYEGLDFQKKQEFRDVNFQNNQEHANDLLVEGGERRWPGWPGDNVFRILIPSQKVGGVIGRRGENIKKMCDETKSRIKILDAPPSARERAVIISAKEIPSASISPAMNGLQHVLKCAIDVSDDERAHGLYADQNFVTARLLVTSIQAKSLIGKQGSNIKFIQDSSRTAVRILDEIPSFALVDDRVVEIRGECSGVHQSVELISAHLRKYLVDHSVIPQFEIQMCAPNTHTNSNYMRQPTQHWEHPQELCPYAPAGGFGNEFPLMPQYPHDNYYPPSDFPPLERRPHHVDSAYGREVPPHMGGHSSRNSHGPPPPSCGQVTQYIQIPLGYADAVIGVSGATISYIRRTSGATIAVQETRGVPGEMTVEINGSAPQVQTAQQMIQNFMAESMPPPPPPPQHAQNSEVSAEQGYSSYPGQSSAMYMSASTNPGVPTPPPASDYHPSYGNNYGY